MVSELFRSRRWGAPPGSRGSTVTTVLKKRWNNRQVRQLSIIPGTAADSFFVRVPRWRRWRHCMMLLQQAPRKPLLLRLVVSGIGREQHVGGIYPNKTCIWEPCFLISLIWIYFSAFWSDFWDCVGFRESLNKPKLVAVLQISIQNFEGCSPVVFSKCPHHPAVFPAFCHPKPGWLWKFLPCRLWEPPADCMFQIYSAWGPGFPLKVSMWVLVSSKKRGDLGSFLGKTLFFRSIQKLYKTDD